MRHRPLKLLVQEYVEDSLITSFVLGVHSRSLLPDLTELHDEGIPVLDWLLVVVGAEVVNLLCANVVQGLVLETRCN